VQLLSTKRIKIISNPNYNNPVEISIILSAYNEENLIEDAVNSVYNSDYPTNLIQLIVGSDGSNDNTNNILIRMKHIYPNLEIHLLDRMGKNSVLNILSPLANGNYIFYMDADCRLKNDSITRLLSVLDNDDIGAVISSMNSIVEDDLLDNLGVHGEGKYQEHEQTLRINESKIHSTVSALGAFYGIKKEFYHPLPNKNVCDDWMPLMYALMNNKRVVFLDDAEVFEVRGKSLKNEIKRRIRITAGGLATIWASKKLLNPKYGWVSFALWSHRVLRYLLPLFSITIFVLSLFLIGTSYFAPLLSAFILFLVLSLIGKFAKTSNKLLKIPKLCSYYTFMIVAQLIALVTFIFERNISVWNHDR
jgi:cellulose synthase/poly-beta-1,6-N-acetylglucosamine synthase-like glycosyltransferase